MRITKLVVVLLCAGALIGCAHNSPDAETRDSGASVGAGSLADELYRSSQAFQKARESSDAVGMAKAVARRPVVIEESLELSEEFLLWRDMTERMKMQTLDMAKDDASTLAIVEDILSRDPPKENELGAFGKNITGIIGSAEKPAAKKAFRLDPGERVELFHRARKSRGSIVYVEGAEDSGLRLVIRDAEHREICRDASPHGVLICRWRPKENGRVKVVIENAGSAPARALLISAEQWALKRPARKRTVTAMVSFHQHRCRLSLMVRERHRERPGVEMLSNVRLIGANKAARPYHGVRLLLVLFLASFLASCFATTDRVAVFERNVLSPGEVAVLAAHYHRTEENGALSSLTLTVRDKPWLYKKVNRGFAGATPFFPPKAISLTAADLAIKTEGGPDGGSAMVEGIAVFSKIPGSDLILMSVPGETSKVTMGGDATDYGSMGAAEAAQSRNLFFVLEPTDEGLGLNIFFEDDEALKKAFASLSKPLPTEELLTYLKDNPEEISHKRSTLQFSKSSPAQRALYSQKIDAALKFAADKKLSPAPVKSEQQTTAKAPKPVVSKAPSDKIQSLDGFFQVSKDGVSEFQVQRVTGAGGYEYIAILRARTFQKREFRPNEIVERGVWFPDTQQFHYEARLKAKNGGCLTWNEANWSHPFVTSKLYHVKGRTMDVWASSALAPRPPSRDKKKICIQQKVNANDCSFVRCTKRANYTSTDITYMVPSQADAFWIYHHHFGNP